MGSYRATCMYISWLQYSLFNNIIISLIIHDSHVSILISTLHIICMCTCTHDIYLSYSPTVLILLLFLALVRFRLHHHHSNFLSLALACLPHLWSSLYHNHFVLSVLISRSSSSFVSSQKSNVCNRFCASSNVSFDSSCCNTMLICTDISFC